MTHKTEEQILIGARVVAVSGDDSKGNLFIFGRGVFEGYFLQPSFSLPLALMEIQEAYAAARKVTPDLPESFSDEEALKAILLSQSDARIHLIETIDGEPLDELIWGNECWWAGEAAFAEQSSAGKYTLVSKSVAEHRAEIEKLAAFKTALFGSGAVDEN